MKHASPWRRALGMATGAIAALLAACFSLPGGGVHLVEATKQLYRPVLRRAVRRVAAQQLEEALEAAGFSNVAHVVHGFEGDLDENFKRSTLNGWRFEGLPWEQL